MAPRRRNAPSTAVSVGKKEFMGHEHEDDVWTSKEIFAAAFRRDLEWNEHNMDTLVYWDCIVMALMCGAIAGLMPLQGWAGFLLFFLSTGLSVWAHLSFLDVDADSIVEGGVMTLVTKSIPTTLGLFLLVWIVLYTVLYYADDVVFVDDS